MGKQDNASGVSILKSSLTILNYSILHLIKIENDKSGTLIDKCSALIIFYFDKM